MSFYWGPEPEPRYPRRGVVRHVDPDDDEDTPERADPEPAPDSKAT